MPASRHRSAYASVAALVTASIAGVAYAADESPLTATMQCEHVMEPGRVRCTVDARVPVGRTLAWADVAVLALPDFATALKGRIGHEDATAREPQRYAWAFALVARRAGQGEVRARVRAVVCGAEAGADCAPVTLDVRAPVMVGN